MAAVLFDSVEVCARHAHIWPNITTCHRLPLSPPATHTHTTHINTTSNNHLADEADDDGDDEQHKAGAAEHHSPEVGDGLAIDGEHCTVADDAAGVVHYVCR